MFVAHDCVTNVEAVIKVFNPERRNPTEAYRWECFARESKVLERLQGQKDIVQLICGQDQFIESVTTHIPGLTWDIEFAFYVMEKADSDVADAILNPTWSPLDYLEAFRTMVRAVQRIHAQGLAHRDLKPDNFLIAGSSIKLSDFGTARFLDGTNAPLRNIYDSPPGDLRYTAPEIFACLHDVTAEIAFKADIFALGAILFEMFTGVKLGIQLFGPALLSDLTSHLSPIPRHQRLTIYKQIVPGFARKHPLPPMHSLNPAIPPAIRVQLNGLYQGMCDLNYVTRNCHFPSIFRGIDTCLLILKNQAKYQAWLAERQRRRSVRLLRKVHSS